jgi:hypothetical protein
MSGTNPQLSDAPPQSATPGPTAPRPGSASPDCPTWGEVFDEWAPMIGVPVFYGPPIFFVMGPWLLLVLLLVGPFALMITLLLVSLVAAGALVALIASPYLLVCWLRARHAARRRRHTLVHPASTVPAVGDLGPQPGRSGWFPAPAAGFSARASIASSLDAQHIPPRRVRS